MKTHVIQLETHDDVISIKDKMTWQSCRRIVLVWPKRGRILANELELVLLHRSAKGLGAELALVTHHPLVREWAQEIELPFFASINSAEKNAWKVVPASIQEKRFAQGVDAIRGKKEAMSKNSGMVINRPIIRGAALVIGLLALFSLFLVIIPSAEITYYPEIRPQEIEINITASDTYGGISPSGSIPAGPVYTEVSGEISRPSSGKTTVVTAKSSGKVTLTNLTQNSLTLPKGTLLLSENEQGAFFSLEDDVKLPGGIGETVEARVEALLPGDDGNIDARQITSVAGETSAFVSVTNEKEFSGGKSLEAPAPNETDYAILKGLLLKQLLKEGFENLTSDLQTGSSLIDGSLHLEEVLIEEEINEVGQPSDEAALRMTVRLKALTVLQNDLKSIAELILNTNRPEGYRDLNEEIEIQQIGEIFVDENDRASWQIKAYCLITPEWDSNQVATMISGMRVKDARTLFEGLFYQTQPADFKLILPWLPFLSTRIHFINGALL